MLQNDALFKSLGDPTRRGLFEHLCREGPQAVGTLTERAGVSQPAVSKHLAVLKSAGFVDARPKGRVTHYYARSEPLVSLLEWVDQMTRFWGNRLDRLDDLLKRMDQ